MATETELERMVVRLIGDGQSYQQMLRDARMASKQTAVEVDRAGTAIEGIKRRLDSVGNSIRSFGRSVQAAGTRLSVAVTAPAMALGGMATKTAVEFETALSRIEGLVGEAADKVAAYREQVLTLAPQLGRDPAEMAKGLEFITSSGLKGAAAIEALTLSGKAATAGMGETKTVADTITSAINAYGAANLSSAKALDVLVATVREGKGEAASFAPVFGQILPLAVEMGVTFEEVGGILAFLTKSTGSASIAATGLRGIMSQLIKGTKEGEKAFAAIGTSLDQINRDVKSKGLLPTLIDLREKMKMKGIRFSEVFSDIEGLNAALQMTGVQAGDAKAVLASVADSAGSLNRAFEAASKTRGFAWAQSMSMMKIQLIELGDIIAPVTNKLLSFSSLAMSAWKGLSTETKSMVVGIVAMVALLGPTLVVVGTVLTSAATVMTATLATLGGVGTVLAGLLSPLGLVAAAVAVVAYNLFDFSALARLSLDDVSKYVVGFVTNFSYNMQQVGSWAGAVWGHFKEQSIVAWNTVSGIVTSALNAISELLLQWVPGLASVWNGVSQGAAGAWERALNWVRSFVSNAIGFLWNFGDNANILWAWIGDNWKNILTDMLNLAQVWASNYLNNVGVLLRTAYRLWVAWQGWMTAMFQKLFTFDFVDAVLTGLIKAGEKIREWGASVAQMVASAFTGGLLSTAFDKFVAQTVADKKRGASTPNFLSTAKGILQEEIPNLNTPLQGFKSSITELPKLNLSVKGVELPNFKFAEDTAKVGEGLATDLIAPVVGRAKKAANEVEDALSGINPKKTKLHVGVEGLDAVRADSSRALGLLLSHQEAIGGKTWGVNAGAAASRRGSARFEVTGETTSMKGITEGEGSGTPVLDIKVVSSLLQQLVTLAQNHWKGNPITLEPLSLQD